MSDVLVPGARLGVLGGGQLGRMFALAAREMGYRVHVLVPEHDSPTGQVSDVEVHAAYDDLDAIARFAQSVDVVTFEFENVASEATEVAAKFAPVRPAGRVLHVTQNRVREKSMLASAGLPVTPFAPLATPADLDGAIRGLGLPAIIKTAAWGYDGKGQHAVATAEQAQAALSGLAGAEAIYEQRIDFDCELSVVGVRGGDGALAMYGPMRNDHVNHILDVSVCPADVDPAIEDEARAIAGGVLEALDVVGVLCVEFFLTTAGKLLINELAPRPHNSGHLTIDAHATCQFEQQVRAICGLALGEARLRGEAAAMANLLGDLWQGGGPDFAAACAYSDVKLHLYGKRQPRVGRKMGHLTVVGDSPRAAAARVRAARAALRPDLS